MFDPVDVPDVGPEEWLARYVLYRKHVRAIDQTVKPDAFIPHPHQELSVTRHRMATDDEIWGVGKQVADHQSRTLYGRADVLASDCTSQALEVRKASIAGNPNHADIANWPLEKSRQKMMAIEIAAASVYKPRPPAEG